MLALTSPDVAPGHSPMLTQVSPRLAIVGRVLPRRSPILPLSKLYVASHYALSCPRLALHWPMLALSWPSVNRVGPRLVCSPKLALSWPYLGPMSALSWPHVAPSCRQNLPNYVMLQHLQHARHFLPFPAPPRTAKPRKTHHFRL